jgi:hypothetical protein
MFGSRKNRFQQPVADRPAPAPIRVLLLLSPTVWFVGQTGLSFAADLRKTVVLSGLL